MSLDRDERSEVPQSHLNPKRGYRQSLAGEFEVPELEPTVRLNADISIELNDALAQKAHKYRIPKTELVRRLLRWGLDEMERGGK